MDQKIFYVIIVLIGLVLFAIGPLYTIKYGTGCPNYDTGKFDPCPIDRTAEQYWPILIGPVMVIWGMYFYKRK